MSESEHSFAASSETPLPIHERVISSDTLVNTEATNDFSAQVAPPVVALAVDSSEPQLLVVEAPSLAILTNDTAPHAYQETAVSSEPTLSGAPIIEHFVSATHALDSEYQPVIETESESNLAASLAATGSLQAPSAVSPLVRQEGIQSDAPLETAGTTALSSQPTHASPTASVTERQHEITPLSEQNIVTPSNNTLTTSTQVHASPDSSASVNATEGKTLHSQGQVISVASSSLS